ncbi:MAG TPA: hypothetical protein VNU95_02215 [Candidatus Acidoferrales bacterium]|jgi:hypothetical protein|nr:hypothetical protein [Candidatus Acidoferrales bacterium]
MEGKLENPAEEIKRLRRCINDLVSVLAISATWSGCEPPQIARTVLDVLLGLVNLDLVYIRLEDPTGKSPIVEMVWSGESRSATIESPKIKELLHQYLGSESQKWPPSIRGSERIVICGVPNAKEVFFTFGIGRVCCERRWEASWIGARSNFRENYVFRTFAKILVNLGVVTN